ncbi:hypothetical protein AOR_1_140114 [Paecilomyces variotii No. 5]|uniref:Uncharacterized protein n=1 Tax=Byssochlamys spectabilis (strain No. 5 / NBRC 109023) TaxID=1356009 RepID=V5G535_BYSSN|nr:hypothetical protein AOR_1_140114 [Paecilomyces variotii No. 5]
MNTQGSGERLISRAYESANRMQNAGEELRSLVEAMAAEVQNKELELEAAREQIGKLEDAVADSTRRLLKSLPVSSLDDTRLQERYGRIRGSIEDWAWTLPALTSSPEYRSNMLEAPALREISTAMKRALKLLLVSSELQSEVLCALTCQIIWKVFAPWTLGASMSKMKFMISLEASMEKLNGTVPITRTTFSHPRASTNALFSSMIANSVRVGDRQATYAWRSNTMRAYIETDGYKENVRQQAEDLCDSAENMLDFVGIKLSDPEKTMDHLWHRVVLPAVQLAQDLDCTPELYLWKWYDESDEDLRELKRPSKSSFERFTMIDVRTNCEVKEDKLIDFTPDQTVGRCLLVVFPALFRRDNEDRAWIQIEKATISVQLQESVSSQLDIQNQIQREMRVQGRYEGTHMDNLD